MRLSECSACEPLVQNNLQQRSVGSVVCQWRNRGDLNFEINEFAFLNKLPSNGAHRKGFYLAT